ncbi:lysophospholipid acyltransferase family protein [Streptomyces sp. NPDC093085]|uniref:lysophospholipid acyltransferase family protein n=1 Tax=Streptomyces sp. NPDC093085 TaxID=3155068 RepID=UPI00343DE948
MSAWLPTAPCTPHDCARHRGPAAGAAVGAARLLAGIPLVLCGALLAPLLAALDGAVRDRLTRRWSRAVLRAFGLRLTVRVERAERAERDGRDEHAAGAPGAGDTRTGDATVTDIAGAADLLAPRGAGVLVVANHISWLDIPLLAAALPGRMLAKSEIRRWPLMGALAARGGTLFVERERLRALPGAVRTLAGALSEGSRVIVFPEACTWCGQERGPFTSAVFQAALDAGAAVLPVRLAYRAPDGTTSGAPAFVGADTLPASLWRVVTAGGLTAEITLLAPVPARSHTERRALSRTARNAVAGSGTPLTDAAPGIHGTHDAAHGAHTTHHAAHGAHGTPGYGVVPSPRAPGSVRQTAVASESAKRPAVSVHQCVSSSRAADSSERTRP